MFVFIRHFTPTGLCRIYILLLQPFHRYAVMNRHRVRWVKLCVRSRVGWGEVRTPTHTMMNVGVRKLTHNLHTHLLL